MSIADFFLSELSYEASITRRMLERAPIEDRSHWRPHPRSTELGYLASHLAQLPDWVAFTVKLTELDLQPQDGSRYTIPTLATREELVSVFDQKVQEAKAALAGATDAQLAEAWTLRAGPQVLLQMPRATVLRSMVFNHMVHHRAQLGVYLRLNDIPIPASYGPSADERFGA